MQKFTAQRLAIPDVIVIVPRKFKDSRGFFMETYVEPVFHQLGVESRFIQDNHSLSEKRGTVRGLHFQIPPHAQAKLVRVIRGSVYDVAVDLRRASPTYGQWCGAMLTDAGGEQIYIPRGFAHGFCTCEPNTEVVYKVDNVYAPDCDGGLIWSDPTLAINWPVGQEEIAVSDKDAKLVRFNEFNSPF